MVASGKLEQAFQGSYLILGLTSAITDVFRSISVIEANHWIRSLLCVVLIAKNNTRHDLNQTNFRHRFFSFLFCIIIFIEYCKILNLKETIRNLIHLLVIL